MKKDSLEPGLLPVFSLYFVARLGVILVSGAVYFVSFGFAPRPGLTPYYILFTVDIVFLSVFLIWPWLRRQLGQAYLPVALMVATAIPIIEGRYLADLYGGMPEARLWLVFPFLSVPLILVAWQYGFPEVVAYCLGTAAFEAVLPIVTHQVVASAEALPQTEAIMARTVFFLLVGHIVSDLVAVQRRQRQELADAHRRLLRYTATLEQLAVSQERNRLARELHDTLAHTLSGQAVQLEAIETLWDANPTRARAMLARALAATRAGLEETRRALRDLRAAPLEDLGLGLAVRSLAESVAGRSGLALRMDVSEHLGELSPEVEQCFYRVAQEALENVARHAGARWVTIALRRTGNRLLLEVEDDGCGFQAAPADEHQFGLKGMYERAEVIGAALTVTSRPEQGTVVHLEKELGDGARPDL